MTDEVIRRRLVLATRMSTPDTARRPRVDAVALAELSVRSLVSRGIFPRRKNRQEPTARGGYTRRMRMNDIRWGAALGGMLVAEVVLVAAAFGWVAIYSLLLHRGESPAFYEQYAMRASPHTH